MPNEKDDLDQFRASIGQFGIQRDPQTGQITKIETDGSDGDNNAMLKALTLLQQGPDLAAFADPPKPSMSLADAILSYEQTEGEVLRPNTFAQRKRALKHFKDRMGAKTPVNEITRPMAQAWAGDLLRSGLKKGYVANNVSHVAQLFEWLKSGGHVSENTVKGVVVLKASEKKARRREGREWEPFPIEVLERIYAPENLKRCRKAHVRWAALIGLYSGARVGEIAQLFLRDFEIDAETPYFLIRVDSDGQSLKTEASERLVPIHPDLVRLGLLDRVRRLRKAGEERLFPEMRIDGNAGAGNAISKGFSYYIKQLEVKPRRAAGIVGFHSLRKTVVQTLQGSALSAERRRAFVGHENSEDVHQASYMRPWSPTELAELFPGLAWGEWMDLDGLAVLLSEKE